MEYKIKGKYCKQWTIPELKKALQRRKEKVSGSKAELCERLRLSLKQKLKPTASTKVKTQKSKKYKEVKPVDTEHALFKFYASTYYQVPGSQMAFKELESYGFTKQYLNKFKTHIDLIDDITKRIDTI